MEKKDIDVVAAGHICIDITPDFGDAATGPVSETLRPGQLVEVGPPTISSGGTVSNTGLALKRLGLEVSLMGKCGADPFGEMLNEIIRAEAPGAEMGMSVIEGENTSYSIVIVLPGKDRLFLHCAGANNTFGAEDIDSGIVGRAKIFHFGYPPLMQRMYSNAGRELANVLGRAREQGAITSLDMSFPDPNSASGRADWQEILSASLPHTSIFLPSIEELMYMLRRERFDELAATDGGVTGGFTAADLRGLAEECLNMGAGITVIKCGHIGAYLRSNKTLPRLQPVAAGIEDWEGAELFEAACRVENIRSATGAGDNAIAGFLTALIRGMGPEQCMKALTAVGAQNLSSVSAVGGVKPWNETLRQLEGNPSRIPIPQRLSEL